MSHDDRHPFDADRFTEGFTEEPARIVHAEDDPVLGELTARAERAWADFLERADDEGTPQQLRAARWWPQNRRAIHRPASLPARFPCA